MSQKDIPIKALRPGMFINKLIIPPSTGFISDLNSDQPATSLRYHQVLIESEQDIANIESSGIKTVTIDTDKGIDIDVDTTAAVNTVASSAAANTQMPKTIFAKTADLNDELSSARFVRRKFGDLTKRLFESTDSDVRLSVSETDRIIEDTLDSLTRNDQALVTLLHIQREKEQLLEHSFAVFCLALRLAQRLLHDKNAFQVLGISAILHDAGWIKLPASLFNKDRSYQPAELQLVERHVELIKTGNLLPADLPEQALRVVAEHHEYCDGSGYPQGLKGPDIFPLSKILTVADYYDELANGLQGAPGYTPSGALNLMYREAMSGKLDQSVVEQLIAMLGIYPIGSAVQLDSGEKALVIEAHQNAPIRPTVKVYYSKRGMPIQPKVINLNKQKKDRDILSIAKVLNPRDDGVDPARVLVLSDE